MRASERCMTDLYYVLETESYIDNKGKILQYVERIIEMHGIPIQWIRDRSLY